MPSSELFGVRTDERPYIIHVNRQHIGMNAKDGGIRPVYTMKVPGGEIHYARSIKIGGESTLVADTHQLKCGARAWIETMGPVELYNAMSFSEARAT
jgi:hypothetical protein